MRVAFKGQSPGELPWNRELLAGGEWMARWLEKVSTEAWLGLQGEPGLSSPRGSEPSRLACGPLPLPLGAGLIFQDDSLGTGSRFSSVESSSFKVLLKCHLLCKDSPHPQSRINHPSSWLPQLW